MRRSWQRCLARGRYCGRCRRWPQREEDGSRARVAADRQRGLGRAPGEFTYMPITATTPAKDCAQGPLVLEQLGARPDFA